MLCPWSPGLLSALWSHVFLEWVYTLSVPGKQVTKTAPFFILCCVTLQCPPSLTWNQPCNLWSMRCQWMWYTRLARHWCNCAYPLPHVATPVTSPCPGKPMEEGRHIEQLPWEQLVQLQADKRGQARSAELSRCMSTHYFSLLATEILFVEQPIMSIGYPYIPLWA